LKTKFKTNISYSFINDLRNNLNKTWGQKVDILIQKMKDEDGIVDYNFSIYPTKEELCTKTIEQFLEIEFNAIVGMIQNIGDSETILDTDLL